MGFLYSSHTRASLPAIPDRTRQKCRPRRQGDEDVQGDRRAGGRREAAAHAAHARAGQGLLGRVCGLGARRRGFGDLRARADSRADRTAAGVRHRGDARESRDVRLDPVRAVPDRLGAVVHLGAARRPLRPRAHARREHPDLLGVHRRGRVRARRVGTGRVPFDRRDRRRRRMGARGHLRGRELAGGPPQDGRRLPADGLLLRLLHRGVP